MIRLDDVLPYDLFVNSSNSEKEKFVRIFPQGEYFSRDDLDHFKKYKTVYVLEMQRGLFLKSLTQNEDISDVEKTEVMRDSAIKHLGKIFDDSKEFTTELLNEAVEGCRESVEAMVETIQEYDIANVKDLIGNLSFHDFYTFDHSVNVSMYCISILKAYKPKATKSELVIAGLGGMLHDLGKIKIPTDIINNPGKLSEEQFAQIKNHPEMGKELFCSHCSETDEEHAEIISRVIYEHHENVNGTGYPNKLMGDQIHLYAKITAIADFFDALTTKRSYHEVMSVQEAVNVMSRSKGKKLDPELFEVFVQSVHHFVQSKKITQELPDDFDPCQPQQALPFLDVVHRKKPKNDFGEIKLVDGNAKQDKKVSKKTKSKNGLSNMTKVKKTS